MRLEPPAKALRSHIILDYLRDAGLPLRVVCLTCGNAARYLRDIGVDVLEIGPEGLLVPQAWLEPEDIARFFPGMFDATSGHLPMSLMMRLADALRARIGPLPEYRVGPTIPSGSGETAVAMALAYPNIRFTAEYNDNSAATTYHPSAPLNRLVAKLCDVKRLPQTPPFAIDA